MYEELVEGLKAIPNVQFTEYEWKTRPNGDFGTIRPDFEAETDNGDDEKQNRAWEGSIDLFTIGKKMMLAAEVESLLDATCGSSWYINMVQYEPETGLLHREFVFQIESR